MESVERSHLARLWLDSGAQGFTDPGLGVPLHVVESVLSTVARLDRRGAGLANDYGFEGLGVLTSRAVMLALPPSGERSCGGATRFVETLDAWMAVSLARPSDIASVPAWIEADDVVDESDAETAWRLVSEAARRRRGRDLVARAVLLGLPCALVGETTDEGRDEGPVIARRRGDAAPTSLGGLTVVNLGSLWAAPLAADVLARLGARVITVESTQRPDGARATPAFFDRLHTSSEMMALPLHTADGQQLLRRLVDDADVVIEGSRPRALEQMGLHAGELVARGPRLWVSLTAHGREGAGRDRVGFGDDAAAAGGLVGTVDGRPRFIADAIGDPLAGLAAAEAVVERVESGGRWLIDVAIARVARDIAGRAMWST